MTPVSDRALGEWNDATAPELLDGAVHVWRIRLDRDATPNDWAVLSPEEDTRARRFFAERHRRRFVVAHGTLRRILASYTGVAASALQFSTGEFGKPSLVSTRTDTAPLEFNLSHSAELALVAVSRGRIVGVDVECWDREVEHIDLAERFFSPAERDALRLLASSPDQVVSGFFAAWSRKEAYLKASGHGITRGLHHFDVTLTPGEPARLLADRIDQGAESRWTMTALLADAAYSAALVAEAPVHEILLFNAA
ncbi:MAG: 4'-phosphopantetheinyl transferase superfamily protein [bacterium]